MTTTSVSVGGRIFGAFSVIPLAPSRARLSPDPTAEIIVFQTIVVQTTIFGATYFRIDCVNRENEISQNVSRTRPFRCGRQRPATRPRPIGLPDLQWPADRNPGQAAVRAVSY